MSFESAGDNLDEKPGGENSAAPGHRRASPAGVENLNAELAVFFNERTMLQ
jgi:hypothetical protein